MPAKGSSYPFAGYGSATLEERNVRSIRAVDSVAVDLVYRQRNGDDAGGTGGGVWSLTDSTQTAHLITFASADGTSSLIVWYEPSASDSQNSPPANVAGSVQTAQRIVGAQKFKPYRVLKATSVLRGTDWALIKDDIHDISGKVNSDVWGGHARGTWLFLGPTTKTFDPAQSTIYIDLVFIQDKDGHFPLLSYLNEKGVHPANSIKESTLRARGLPSVGQVVTGRGLSIASIYKEASFSSKFSFTP
jgi:hypothetical protein